MLALNTNNYINELKRLQVEISSTKQPSIVVRVIKFFLERRLLKKAQRVNKKLKKIISLAKEREGAATLEEYNSSKELLFTVKSIESECGLFPDSLAALVRENISLAYELEKTIRIKYHTNQPKKQPSVFTQAVSTLSRRTTANKI